ncbi:MAG: hypothetical protein RL742_1253, partial [Bacteroidota bacterium]
MITIRNLLILNLILASSLIFMLITSFKGEGATGGGGSVSPEQTVRSINLDKPFSFCGEKVPMDNFDVRQRLDAELLRNVYYHSQTILSIKRA